MVISWISWIGRLREPKHGTTPWTSDSVYRNLFYLWLWLLLLVLQGISVVLVVFRCGLGHTHTHCGKYFVKYGPDHLECGLSPKWSLRTHVDAKCEQPVRSRAWGDSLHTSNLSAWDQLHCALLFSLCSFKSGWLWIPLSLFCCSGNRNTSCSSV